MAQLNMGHGQKTFSLTSSTSIYILSFRSCNVNLHSRWKCLPWNSVKSDVFVKVGFDFFFNVTKP